MSKRSLRVHRDYIEKAKQSLRRNCFATQRHLADDIGYSRSTISNFMNGKPVDNEYFQEICRKLGLDFQKIADFENDSNNDNCVEDIADSTVDLTESPISNYVERPPIEERCYQTLLQPGSLLRIKAPKEMGKTSLMVRILSDAKTQGYETVTVDLRQAEGNRLQDLDRFLFWFCQVVTDELKLPSRGAEYWEKDLGSSYQCTRYFKNHLLAKVDSPMVLALDEVDRLFPYPNIAEDFFGLLRSWYELAKRTDIWKNLRLILAYSTDVYIPLDINNSPFNVGEPISLPEFTPRQVEEFARRQGVDWEPGEIEQVMNLIGGHPSLLQMAVSRLERQEITLEELLQTAATESGIYSDHLRIHLDDLKQNPDLAAAMKQAVATDIPVRLESKITCQLRRLGLVTVEGNDCRITCDLYRQYFRDRL